MPTRSSTRDRKSFHRTDDAPTDRELLLREFDAADPESLEGITIDPQSDGEPEVEFSYDLRGRGHKARCVYCKYENHFEGVVIRYPSGERALVGRDCAVQRHGAGFNVLLDRFDAQRDRRDCLVRRNAILSAWGPLREQMAELIVHPAVQTFDGLAREWRNLMGSMFPGLAAIACEGAPRLGRRIRDQAAEDKRAADMFGISSRMRRKAERSGEVPPIFTGEVDDLGPLGGAAFFRTGTPIRRALRVVDETMRDALRRLNADDLSTRSMRAIIVELGECQQRITTELVRLGSLSDVFEAANLSRLAAYANARAAVERPQEAPIPRESLDWYTPASRPVTSFGRFHASERAFHRTAGGQSWSVELPTWFKVPQAAVLGTLRRVLA